MPYLDRLWIVDGKELPLGTWVPERNWDRWWKREEDLPGAERPRLQWRRRDMPTVSSPERVTDACLAVLARDIASAQRDGFLYTNLIERLKDAPSDATADEVVEQMRTLGLASADWPEEVGGPPRRESPRPVRKVLDWLLGLAAQVAKFLMDCVGCVAASLSELGVSAVALGISWPPSVSFEFPPGLLVDPTWSRARAFFDHLLAELSEKVFSA